MRLAQPAQVIECRGCEQNCLMPVHIRPAENPNPARAFIACDKRDDIGRVQVDFSRLEQWQMTVELLATVLSKLLGANAPLMATRQEHEWSLGSIKGKTNSRAVTLLVQDGLRLSVAGHRVSVSSVLKVQAGVLSIDRATLARFVDSPTGNPESTEERKQRLKTRIQQEKMKGTRGFQKIVAAEEGISVSRLKQIIGPTEKKSADLWPVFSPSKKSTSSKKTKSQH